MKNYEKYKDKIYSHDGEYFCHDFVKPIILKVDECDARCTRCRLIQAMWLMEEYEEEPEVNWSTVEVDTPILVRDSETGKWLKRYFAKFKDGKVYAWLYGGTSWSSDNNIYDWKYAKLAEQEE